MKHFILLLVAGSFLSLIACNKNSTAGNATINVHLVDGPGAYDNVFIDIQDVQVKADNDNTESGWQSLNISRKGVYDLLKFKNGIDTSLGTLSLPAGSINQVRLILGNNNSVVLNGVSYPLNTPSAQQSGLKLAFKTNLTAGVNYDFYIDFDAARSIVQTGNGKYNLKPVIKVFTEATSGAIKGVVAPASAKTWVYAILNVNDTITSTLTDGLSGAFLLRGLPVNSYKVAFSSSTGTFRDTVYNNVSVTNGAVTNIGTVQLR